MVRPIDRLRGLVDGKKNLAETNTGLLMSELGAFDAIVGADYEVTDGSGNLIARLRRKPISPEQVRELLPILEEVIKAKNPKKK